MATKTKAKASKTPAKTNGVKRDVCQEVTDRIVEALEKGVSPWQRPWSGATLCNGHSGYVYKGVNVILLMLGSEYTDNRWYTYKQVADNYEGSHVRKGEKGTKVVYWAFRKVEEKTVNPSTGEETTKLVKIPFPIMHTVFNHEQIEWAEGKENQKHGGSENVNVVNEIANFDAVARVVESSGAVIEHKGARACYNRATDKILLPKPAKFKSAPDYWSTMLHELVHWTGHKNRLNRDFGNRFGDNAYAFEELVAEIGSAFLCSSLGVVGTLQHESYVANWIKVLKGDKYAIFTAAKKSQEAMNLLLGKEEGEEDAEEGDETEAAPGGVAEVAQAA